MVREMINDDKAWLDYRNRFSSIYDNSNYSSSLQRKVMHSSHRLLEKNFDSQLNFARVIEVGAGTGEHLSFVRHRFDEYVLTDLDSETLEVAKAKHADNPRGKLRFEVQTGGGLGYPDNTFDRLIATHVLEHISQPHLVLNEWARVIKPGGVLSILIPTDPGFAWRLGRHLGPRRNAIAQGIAYDYVMAREHVNSCTNLVALLRHYFLNSKEAWWPFLIPSVDLNLFFSFNAVISKEGA